MRFLSIISFVMILANPAYAANAKAEMFKTAVKVVGGLTALFSATGAYSEADVLSEINAKMEDLKKQGFNIASDAIYNVIVDVDPNASDRWFFSPNLYLVVQIPGYGDFIPRSFKKSYKGGKWSFSFFAPVAKSGIMYAHAMDNKHEFLNTSLNSLLQTKVNISVSPEFTASFGEISGTVRIQQLANFSLKVIDEDITFSPPSVIATSSIQVPPSATWTSQTSFYSKDKEAGTMLFSCLTTGSQLRAEARWSTVKIILIIGVGIIILYVCYKCIARKESEKRRCA